MEDITITLKFFQQSRKETPCEKAHPRECVRAFEKHGSLLTFLNLFWSLSCSKLDILVRTALLTASLH